MIEIFHCRIDWDNPKKQLIGAAVGALISNYLSSIKIISILLYHISRVAR